MVSESEKLLNCDHKEELRGKESQAGSPVEAKEKACLLRTSVLVQLNDLNILRLLRVGWAAQ